MFHKHKITLAKSIIFEHLEEFLNDIIELKYVTIEVGMGIDKYHPTTDLQANFLSKLDELKRILENKKIPLENIRMHIPLGYRYDLVDKIWDSKKQKLYDSFNMLYDFIKKADKLGFRHFVMHAPWICIKTISKKTKQTFETDYDEALDNYCEKLKKLRKSIKGTIYMEYLAHNPEWIVNNKDIYKKFMGSTIHQYKRIIRTTGIEPLLDTGIFDSIEEYKIAKKDLESEGFLVKAIHIQGNMKKAHHMPLSHEEFEQIIDDFAGVIIDEGFYKHRFKKGELNTLLNKGEDLKHLMLTPKEQIGMVKEYLTKLKDKRKANLLFKLKQVTDKDLK